ncbi:hypothetical protein EUGRSUZ_J01898 [Eucalyptus grandis]|uniref:Uncharacterized protein n=2 Tax=Eucalyptus grandis TaxID=71139 RepID=A0ACC3J6F7_EUCGR|nr:hypothetical protein EUGRSUZ_J01898 [Eucalyptus grandis]
MFREVLMQTPARSQKHIRYLQNWTPHQTLKDSSTMLITSMEFAHLGRWRGCCWVLILNQFGKELLI